jgi:hypothetical protein
VKVRLLDAVNVPDGAWRKYGAPASGMHLDFVLDKPHHIYRDLMHNLRIPGGGRGAQALAEAVVARVRSEPLVGTDTVTRAQAAYRWLHKNLQCGQLAWLLSDPRLLQKQILVGLLGCEPWAKASAARRASIWKSRPADWPAFSASTQGDFACFLLSGIGRLARLLGHKGLIILLDEMERWQDLNWQAQSRAGNLLGGLIWGATAEEGEREPVHQPAGLTNSRRCGGTPFTTSSRCYLGLAIAMTPRGQDGPESLWAEYGRLHEVDLPPAGPQEVIQCVRQVAPWYASAHGLPSPELSAISARSLEAWRRSDGSFRTAVQIIIRLLDEWRDAGPSTAPANGGVS